MVEISPLDPHVRVTPYSLALQYKGVKEIAGEKHHPLIQWWLSLCGMGPYPADETPWCSALVNGICWELGLDRSGSAAARSWLTVGDSVALADAKPGFDVAVLSRGTLPQPGKGVLNAPGHVGFFVYVIDRNVGVLGGNQGNQVSIASYPVSRILDIRRIPLPEGEVST